MAVVGFALRLALGCCCEDYEQAGTDAAPRIVARQVERQVQGQGTKVLRRKAALGIRRSKILL